MPSVLWILRQGELPRALLTDARGVTTPKVVDFVDLLSALDDSVAIKELEREPPERRLPLPALPEGALFADVIERVSGPSYVVTGVMAAREHPLVAEGGHAEDDRGRVTTHDVFMPPIVYRAVWRPHDQWDDAESPGEARGKSRETPREQPEGSLGGLSIGVLSPDHSGPPGPDSQVFRYPLPHAGGRNGRVCWSLGGVRCALREVPEKAVSTFISAPTDAGPGHARQVSAAAPVPDLRGFLEACEAAGGLSHDWLEPFDATVEDFHQQKRSDS